MIDLFLGTSLLFRNLHALRLNGKWNVIRRTWNNAISEYTSKRAEVKEWFPLTLLCCCPSATIFKIYLFIYFIFCTSFDFLWSEMRHLPRWNLCWIVRFKIEQWESYRFPLMCLRHVFHTRTHLFSPWHLFYWEISHKP